MADSVQVPAGSTGKPQQAEVELTFSAGLAEVHSFLTMAEERLQRLSAIVTDEEHARQVDEISSSLRAAQHCVERHWRRA